MTGLLVMYSNDPPTPQHLARLQALVPGARIVAADSEAAAVGAAAGVEAMLGHRYLRQVLPRADRLRWVQSTASGVAHLPTDVLAARRIVLTRCPIFADTVATHAITLALCMLRGIPDALRTQARGTWGPRPAVPPLPRTAMVVGLGSVGQAIVTRLRPLVPRIIGVARRPSPVDAMCNDVRRPETWRQALPEVDVCLLAVGDGAENRHLVDERVLRLLPAHAVLVNVGRGSVLDQAALLRTLHDGHLAGAALDVLDPVPLNADDPLWHTPRLLVTPKSAVFTSDRQTRLERFVEEQLERAVLGHTLQHVVPTTGSGQPSREAAIR